MDDQTLELQIKSNMEQANSSIDGIISQLLSMSGAISNVSTKVDANGKLTLKSLTTITKEGNKLVRTFQKVDKDGNLKLASSSARTLSENIKNAGNNASASTPKFSKMTNVLSKLFTFATVRRAGDIISDFLKVGIDRTEQLNLFNVVFDNIEKNGVQTFSTLGKEATQFQYKLKEAFGTNMTETLKYQALFRSMGDNVGIPDNPSSLMAETMAKFTYDLASLYNQEESNVAEALRAGVYAGQTKPLRSYGIDVTQQSMQPILDELGIERSVKQLSQAEKEILRYITALRQGQVAMGDFANTVESPSNQLKVFRQQLVEAKINLTSLFIGSFQKILPYANALLMVVSEVSKAIADMFGIKLTDYNSGIASQESAYEDLEDQIDGTTQAVKELKRQTFGFDEIHNIDENTDNSGAGSITGGIDQRLLEAITGYDNGMEKVRMKATEIRDRIMEWLGFHKEIDPITGEISWKLVDVNSTMGKIITSIIRIIKKGKEAISGVFQVLLNDFDNGAFGTTIVTIFNLIGDALEFIGKNKSAQKTIAKILELMLGIKALKLIPGFSKLTKYLKDTIINTRGLLSPLKSLKTELGNVNAESKTWSSILSEGITNWSNHLSGLDKIKLGISGIATSYTGIQLLKVSMDDANTSGINLLNTLGQMSGALMTTFGGAQIGSIFGPWGTAIGSLTGSLEALYTSITAGQESIKKAHEYTTNTYKKYKDALDKAKESAKQNSETSLVQIERTKELIDELGNLVDSNGKVKESDEERVNFILNQVNEAFGTEYKLIDGTITKNGEQVKSYGEVRESLNKLIEKKKAEVLLSAFEEEYKDALLLRKQYTEDLTKKQANLNEVLDEYNKGLETGRFESGRSKQQIERYIEVLNIQIEDLKTGISDANDDILNYEALMSSSLSENSEAMEKAMKNYGVTVDETISDANQKVALFYDTNSKKELSCEINLDTENAEEAVNNYYTSWNGKTIGFELESKITKAQDVLSSFYKLWSGKKITFDVDAEGKYTVWEKELGGSFYGNKWHSIQQYANGGVPSHGTLFVGGEHGPEIAGHINGRTEILNQSQLASVMFSAVVNGMAQVMSQYAANTGQDIRVYAEEGIIVEKVARGFEEKVKQTGALPFTIP